MNKSKGESHVISSYSLVPKFTWKCEKKRENVAYYLFIYSQMSWAIHLDGSAKASRLFIYSAAIYSTNTMYQALFYTQVTLEFM